MSFNASSKQDRQGVRTATDLEQKYQFGKTFAEILGVANDARESVDSVASSLRTEMQEQATSLRRDTEQIVMEATRDLVKESDFDEYKETAKTEFKVYADGISTKVEKTEQEVSSLSEKIDGIEGLYFYIMYSEFADGHIMTSEPNANTLYMGTCSTNETLAPIDYREYTWTKVKGDDGVDGQDAILLMIDSSAGNLFKNSNIATTLTAHIYKGGAEVTGSALSALGTIKWYKDGGATAVGTGQTLTISAGDVSDRANYTAQLEA